MSDNPEMAQTQTIVNTDGSFTENWAQEYGDDAPTLSRFKDVGSLAKSYMEARKKMGKDPSSLLEVPNEHSSDEAKKRFKEATGWSEKLDDYKYEPPEDIKAKVEIDDKKLSEFKEFAQKELEISPSAFSKLMDYYYKTTAQDIDNFGLVTEQQSKEAYEGAVKTLKQHLGSDFDVRSARAKALLQRYGEKPVKTPDGEIVPLEKLFEEVPQLKNSPWMTIILDNLAESLSEDSLKGLQTPSAPTSLQISERISSIQAHPAFFDKKHPEHNKVMQEYNNLWRSRN